jgi:hypothetical protein
MSRSSSRAYSHAGDRGVGNQRRDGAMASAQDCIEFAKQCERLASLCEDDPELQEHLLELAREWMAMAAQDTVEA